MMQELGTAVEEDGLNERSYESVLSLIEEDGDVDYTTDVFVSRSGGSVYDEFSEKRALDLYRLAEENRPPLKAKIELLCSKMVNCPKSRLIRRTAAAALKLVTQNEDGQFWPDYFIILEALEEPQFHLVDPVLPKIEALMEKFFGSSIDCIHSDCDCIRRYWHWMEVLFVKLLRHPNGWIRYWALLKIVSTQHCKCSFSFSFIIDEVFPTLLDNDLYWRLLEADKVESFIDESTLFLLHSMERWRDEDKVRLLEAAFERFIFKPKPGPVYFFSILLKNLSSWQILSAANIPLLKKALMSCENIQYRCLKFGVVENLIGCFVRNASWDMDTIWSFSSIFSYIINFENDNNFIGLLEYANGSVADAWSNGSAVPDFDTCSLSRKYIELATLDDSVIYPTPAYAHCLWIIAEHYGVSTKLFQEFVYLLLNNSRTLPALEFNAVMVACLTAFSGRFGELEGTTQESLVAFLSHFWSNGLFGRSDLFEAVKFWMNYRSFFKKVSAEIEQSAHGFYAKISDKLLQGSEEQKALMADVLNVFYSAQFDLVEYEKMFGSESDVFKKCHFELETLIKFGGQHANSFMFDEAYIVSLRPYFLNCDTTKVLPEVLEMMGKAVGWSEKKILFYILKTIMTKEGVEWMPAVLDSLWSTVNEEKNSRHYLSILKEVLSVALHEKALLSGTEKEECAINYVKGIIEGAPKNLQVYYLVTEKILSVSRFLSTKWIELLFSMSLYGSIPSKDVKVSNEASRLFFASAHSTIPMDAQFSNIDKPYNLVKYGRLQLMFSLKSLFKSRRNSTTESLECVNFLIGVADSEMEGIVRQKNSSYGLSLGHRQKTRLCQCVLLLTDGLSLDVMRHIYYWCIKRIVEPNLQYSVKLLLEFILMRCLNLSDELVDSFISNEKLFATERIGIITSWINVLLHVAIAKERETGDGKEKTLVELCFLLFLPWCTAQNFSIRTTAVAALKRLWDSIDDSVRSKLPFIKAVVNFEAEVAGNGRRIVQMLCHDFYFAVFNPIVNFTWETVLEIFPKKTGMPVEEIIPSELFLDVLREVNTCGINMYEQYDTLKQSPSLIYGKLSTQVDKQLLNRTFGTVADEEVTESSITFTSSTAAKRDFGVGEVQRKFSTLRGKWKRPRDKSMIVVASLINKSTNLGGICRTCEVFGMDKLVVADLNVLNDREFQCLSTSSEKWMDFYQVRPTDLKCYLEECRASGYTVVVSEQSTNSVPFTEFKIPARTVLLLGDEKKGVPVELIRSADVIVEIPQYGQTGSLNVHVSAALFIQRFAETHYRQ